MPVANKPVTSSPTITGVNGKTYTQDQVSKAYAAGTAEQKAAWDAKTGTTGGQLKQGATTVQAVPTPFIQSNQPQVINPAISASPRGSVARANIGQPAPAQPTFAEKAAKVQDNAQFQSAYADANVHQRTLADRRISGMTEEQIRQAEAKDTAWNDRQKQFEKLNPVGTKETDIVSVDGSKINVAKDEPMAGGVNVSSQTAQGATGGQPKAPTQPQSPKDVAAAIFQQNPSAKVTDFQKFINDSGKAGTPDENKVWDAYHEYTHMQLGLNKYGSSDVNSLSAAISSGDLAVGSPTWNALTVHNPNAAAAKAKYEADLKTKTNNELASKLVSNEGGKSVTSSVSGNTLENLSDKITSKVSDPFQIYSLADALAQNPEVLANKQKVLASDKKIDDLTKAKMRNYEDLKKQYPNVPQSVIMGMEAKMDKDLDEQIYNEQRDRNYSAGMLTYYADIAKSQVEARNEIAKEQRAQLFAAQQMQAQQAFQQQMDKTNFAQQKELATMGYANQAAQQKAQFAQQEKMANLQNSFDQQGYEAKTMTNDQGQQVVTYTKKGNPKDSMSFDANGVPVAFGGKAMPPRTEQVADTMQVVNAVSGYKVGQVGGECTKFASDAMEDAGFGRALSTGLRSNEDDTVAFKASKTNTSVPSVGSAIALNNGTKYGHWGIVTGVGSDGRVSYVSSNENGDKKITYSSVKNSDRNVLGYYNPNFTGAGKPATEANGKYEKLADAVFSGAANSSDWDVKTRTAMGPVLKARADKIRAEGGDPVLAELSASAVNTKEISDSSIQKIGKAKNVVRQLDGLKDLLIKDGLKDENGQLIDTAPLTGWLRSKNPWDTDAQTINASLKSIVPNLARGVFGEVGVLTDQDIAQYTKTIPNLSSTDAVKKAVMALTLKATRNSLVDSLQTEAQSGRDVSRFVNSVKELDDKVSSIESELGIGKESENTVTNNKGKISVDDYLKSIGR